MSEQSFGKAWAMLTSTSGKNFDDAGKLKETKSKREKVTLEKIYSKFLELESTLAAKTI